MNNNTKHLQEDEVELRELFLTLWNKKNFILGFTFFITLSSFIFLLLKTSPSLPAPLYKGSLLVEIGEIKTKTSIFQIDDVNNLKYILETISDVTVSIPKRTNKLIQINSINSDKEKIKENILIAYEKLIKKQNEKLKFYKDYIVSKKIGDIKIKVKINQINKPKKKLVISVSFIAGLTLSIFLVLFMQFIKNLKEEKEKND